MHISKFHWQIDEGALNNATFFPYIFFFSSLIKQMMIIEEK